jgi:anti-anti-sigma regulatory factor
MAEEARELRRALSVLVEGGFSVIEIDLTRHASIDRDTARLLAHAANAVEAGRGRLRVRNASLSVIETLESSGLGRLVAG